jgi:hypothetical protein
MKNKAFASCPWVESETESCLIIPYALRTFPFAWRIKPEEQPAVN